MTGFDEITIQQAEIRHQYNLMIDLKAKMNKEKELLELQIRENYVNLISRKKSLYQQWMFGLVDFDKGVKMVQTYIAKLNRKEITKRTKAAIKDLQSPEFVERNKDHECWSEDWTIHDFIKLNVDSNNRDIEADSKRLAERKDYLSQIDRALKILKEE